MKSFDSGAQFYEAFVNAGQRMKKEGPFLSACLDNAGGRRVVDLACGTGVHALYLAEQGAEVLAVDLSEGMIAYASEHRPHENITYVAQDMREVESQQCNLALCLGNSLCLLEDDAALATVFQRVADMLEEGGLFAVQVVNYGKATNAEARLRVEEREDAGVAITAVKSLVPHGKRTYLSLTYFASEGDRVNSVAETAVLRHLDADALKTAADNAGLKVIATYGDFAHSAFEPESNDLIMLFAKAADDKSV